MINVSCVITKESSTLKAEISIHMEIVLQSLLLSSLVTVLQTELHAAAREILRQLFAGIEAIWLSEKAPGIRVCIVTPKSNTIIKWHYFCLTEPFSIMALLMLLSINS